MVRGFVISVLKRRKGYMISDGIELIGRLYGISRATFRCKDSPTRHFNFQKKAEYKKGRKLRRS